MRFLFTVVEQGTASKWKELLENKVCGAHAGWLLRFALLLAARAAASGVSVETLYFSSFPSRISSTSEDFNKVTFVAMLLCPSPSWTICFRSSKVASLRHNEGYFLYKEPLNIRRKFPTSDPIMYESPSPSWKEAGFWPYVRTAILPFIQSRLPTVLGKLTNRFQTRATRAKKLGLIQKIQKAKSERRTVKCLNNATPNYC